MKLIGFAVAKAKVIESLRNGTYQHELRGAIDVKNALATGEVSATEVINIVQRCNGTHHRSSIHHSYPSIEVHILRRDGWYIKFYFLEPDTWFISVHR
jgi:hypothetical protein